MPLFGKKKHKDSKQGSRKPTSPRLDSHKGDPQMRYSVNLENMRDSRSPTPSSSMYEMNSGAGSSASLGRSATISVPKQHSSLPRDSSTASMSKTRAYFEEMSNKKPSIPGSADTGSWSPEKHRTIESPNRSIPSQTSVSLSITSPTSRTPTLSGHSYSNYRPTSSTSSYSSQTYSSSQQTDKRESYSFEPEMASDVLSLDSNREKSFGGADLALPPLQTTTVKHRNVLALKNAPGGGFGFILRKSYLPVPEDPDKTRLVHLVEPRADYTGQLMTGDRIIEVNGESVDEAPHERVVELIKTSGNAVEMVVASMPELLELNTRGAFDDPFKPRSHLRKSGRAKAGTGTLRKKASEGRKTFKVWRRDYTKQFCLCVAEIVRE